jgi:hypothetical protein
MPLWWFRRRDVSWCRKSTQTNFLHTGNSKKRFARIRGCEVLSRRMAMKAHHITSGHIKKGLWWNRWSDVTKCRKATRRHFPLPGFRRKQIGCSRLSDVFSRRLGLRTHNLTSGRLKNRLWRKATRCVILHPGHCKKRLLRSLLSDD